MKLVKREIIIKEDNKVTKEVYQEDDDAFVPWIGIVSIIIILIVLFVLGLVILR